MGIHQPTNLREQRRRLQNFFFLHIFPGYLIKKNSWPYVHNKVPSILRDSPGLQYLNLTGTQLRQLDVSYLATLIWINHLDLSSNKLHNKLNVLRRMLEQLHNLQILEMIDCDLDDECLDEIIPAFKILEKLEVVNLTNNLILRHDFNVNQCRILTG